MKRNLLMQFLAWFTGKKLPEEPIEKKLPSAEIRDYIDSKLNPKQEIPAAEEQLPYWDAEEENRREDAISDAFADEVPPTEKGDVVYFGSYEQDNDFTNGKEPIEWLVVRIQDGKALLLSKDVLDYQQYHSAHASITWEECAIRAWLNDSFLNAAFTIEEQAQLLPVIINTDIRFVDDTDML